MRYVIALLFVYYAGSCTTSCANNCNGKFLNPLTDIDWRGIFPIHIMGMKVIDGESDKESFVPNLCTCTHNTPVPHPKIGVPISFWNPTRLIDVTRTPYCMVNLGFSIANSGVSGRGHVSDNHVTGNKESFYHVHWYVYPIIHILNCLLSFGCHEMLPFDAVHITEIDPFWRNDNKAAIFNPEAGLFGEAVAQLACMADCVKATAGVASDQLFWCSGCQGSLYPFTGTVTSHTGGVQASLLVAGRMLAYLHRQMRAAQHTGKEALCYPDRGKNSMIVKKSGYRFQMTYPLPDRVKPMGRSALIWQAGKEYPYKGEDFGYLLFSRRDCCLGANNS